VSAIIGEQLREIKQGEKGNNIMEKEKCALEEEYKDLSANMRHYSNMQFAELTVLVAITAGLMTLLTKPNSAELSKLIHFIHICGITIAVIFWLMEESAIYMWAHFATRAAQIEELGYRQYLNLPGAPNFKCYLNLRPGSWEFVCCALPF
jgi:hypothetical protein